MSTERHVPTTYVCVMSEHNVAELQCVLTIRPAEVIAVASSWARIGERSALFKDLVEREMGGATRVRIVGAEQAGSMIHSGSNYDNATTWARGALLPLLAEARDERGHRVVLNYTGGTKASCFALRDAWDWDVLHYKALEDGKDVIEEVDLRAGTTWKMAVTPVTPLQQAQLYTSNRRLRQKPASEICGQRSSLTLAQRAHDQIDDPGRPFPKLMRLLQNLWFSRDRNHRPSAMGWRVADGRVHVPLDHLVGDPTNDDDRAFLGELVDLDTRDDALTFDIVNEHLVVPRKGREKNEWRSPFIAWLAGEWFEQVVYAWACDLVGRDHVTRNLEYKLDDEDTGNELDVLIQYRGRLFILEAKAGDDRGELGVKTVDKLQAASLGLGKVAAAFVVTPDFSTGNANRDAAIFSRARSRDIPFLWGREELEDWVKGREVEACFMNLSNHALDTWLPAQIEAAKALGAGEPVELEGGLGLVDPAADSDAVAAMAANLAEKAVAQGAAAALVSTEYTLTTALVAALQRRGVRCYAATTRREAKIVQHEDGTIEKTSMFRFVQWREFPPVTAHER